jgi:hypothetical protein
VEELAEFQTEDVDKRIRGFELQGIPANSFYTAADYPYRSVDSDIDSDMQI